MSATPAFAQSYWRVPPEEAPHQLTIMMWPNSRRVYGASHLEIVQESIAEIASVISEFEPVALLADRAFHNSIRRQASEIVELWDIPTDDLWARDAAPIFAQNDDGDLAITHIQFNGWGEKQYHRNDARVAERVAAKLGLPLIASGLYGEGGGLDHDGHGALIAHESSWVNDNRNPGLSRDQISARLLKAYGADRITWARGVYGQDITDYHIDSIARFTGPNRILINLPDDPDMRDPFHAAAVETYDTLVAAGYDVDLIPEPNRRRVRSPDFVAAYVNFYVCNGAVVAAEFGDEKTDVLAADALSRHYPAREIIMLNADRLGEIGGGIHCATQQMPA